MAEYSYEIGTTAGGTTNVESLATPVKAPKSTFNKFSESAALGDATVRGLGFPVASWRWGWLDQDEYDQLRAFCSGKSAEIYINTKKDDGSYDKYSCVMVWPDMSNIQKQERDGSFYYQDFTIEFRHLEAV